MAAKGLQRNNPSFRVSCCHHGGMSVVEGLEASAAAKFSAVFPHLDERQRRLNRPGMSGGFVSWKDEVLWYVPRNILLS